MPFEPRFSITSNIASSLMRIEAAREAVELLPITPGVLASLRETARLYSTHYSTMIEGNRLTHKEVSNLITKGQHFPGRGRDEREVLGYYKAQAHVEQLADARISITEEHIQTLHALVMSGGGKRGAPTAYRDGQNVIRDGASGRIVYLPPEAKDVSLLMRELVSWLGQSEKEMLPCPLRAGIAHYQFATIHPYYDGNGRTARLLTTLILHLGGYGLKGLYSLEEYYARNLSAYYDALTVGPSHNYYEGRAGSDITDWISYFCNGMSESFGSVRQRAAEAAGKGSVDQASALRDLDPRQRKALTLFVECSSITSRDIQTLFACSERTARNTLAVWVREGFLVVASPAKKNRSYKLAPRWEELASIS